MRKCSPWSIKDEGEKLRNEPYEYLLFLKIHTEMKKLVSFVIKIDWEFVSPSNNPPSHCISLNSFSQTLLLIIFFPSYIYNLHILIHPLVCQHILFLIHFTYFYWPSPGFPDHLLLLPRPPPMGSPITFFYWVPLFDSWFLHHSFLPRSPPKVSLITYFYWYPLGLPQGDTWPVWYRECYDSCPASCCHSDRSVVGRRSLIGCRWPRCWAAWHTGVGGRPLRNLSP